MTDTLKSIAEGMECECHHCCQSLESNLTASCNCACPKCQLLALQAEYEKVDLVQKWLNSLSQCVGYPTCDGDLVATDHSPACPEYGRERAAIGVRQCAAELTTWLAVNVERIKAEARLEAQATDGNSMTYISELLGVIRRLHDVEVKHIESVPVKESFQGKTVWDGVVEVFELIGHPKVPRVYAWAYGTDDPKQPRKHVAVRHHIPPVTSPRLAVRAAIAQEFRNSEVEP